jgi:hypothetical protein
MIRVPHPAGWPLVGCLGRPVWLALCRVASFPPPALALVATHPQLQYNFLLTALHLARDPRLAAGPALDHLLAVLHAVEPLVLVECDDLLPPPPALGKVRSALFGLPTYDYVGNELDKGCVACGAGCASGCRAHAPRSCALRRGPPNCPQSPDMRFCAVTVPPVVPSGSRIYNYTVPLGVIVAAPLARVLAASEDEQPYPPGVTAHHDFAVALSPTDTGDERLFLEVRRLPLRCAGLKAMCSCM